MTRLAMELIPGPADEPPPTPPRASGDDAPTERPPVEVTITVPGPYTVIVKAPEPTDQVIDRAIGALGRAAAVVSGRTEKTGMYP